MTDINYKSAYELHVRNLEARLGTNKGLRDAIGGDFIAVGKLEYYLLRSLGLSDDHLIVDIGCGSGRLATQLAPFPNIRYKGVDVVSKLLDFAKELCKRPDWEFIETGGLTIPCADDCADFICLFSVVTHLLHEQSFKYFLEARRCLKSGGILVISFLEFKLPFHWEIFIASVNQIQPGQHLNQFVERDAIAAWAGHSGFEIVSIRGGDAGHIPIPEEIVFESGVRQGTLGTFGQSVAVLKKL